jgi:spore germination protein GerM
MIDESEVTRGGAMKRRLGLLVIMGLAIAALAAAGCGGGGGGTTPTTPKTTPGTRPSTSPTGRNTVMVFFVKGQSVSSIERVTTTPSAQVALNLMLQGPTDSEKALGYTTAIPAGTRLLSYTVTDGQASAATATADFSKELANIGGGSAMVQSIISQIDNTVVNNDKTVKAVKITVEGKPVEEVLQP